MIADQQSKIKGEKPFRLIFSVNPSLVEILVLAWLKIKLHQFQKWFALSDQCSETSENKGRVTFKPS